MASPFTAEIYAEKEAREAKQGKGKAVAGGKSDLKAKKKA